MADTHDLGPHSSVDHRVNSMNVYDYSTLHNQPLDRTAIVADTEGDAVGAAGQFFRSSD
jgi:hypothetical protein